MATRRPPDATTQRDRAGEPLAPVVRLHPIRMLVISTDLAYHKRAQTVLAELGQVLCAVTSLAVPDDIACLAAHERADVVLLDATDCENAADDVIAALAEAAPRAGVVSVCHHCTVAARELGALPKWGWTQDLRAGVEDAYRAGNPLSPLAARSLRRGPAWRRIAGPLSRR